MLTARIGKNMNLHVSERMRKLASAATLTEGTTAVTSQDARSCARDGLTGLRAFLDRPANRPVVECALRIRAVESALYDLFGKGKLHGTIHTCLGQEFTGAILGRHLKSADFVTSNHRCHGHFIGATGNWKGLIDELVGNRDGVCAGIGSSQHLWAPNFISNGQQGGLLPVAAGVALSRKQDETKSVVASFIGEGTLGEGIVYETLNLDSLWSLPHLVICENNFYSQSTPQSVGIAGSISARAASFGIPVFEADTWDLEALDRQLFEIVGMVRDGFPAFLRIATYRLNPHSKGDDQRDREEIDWFRQHDAATIAIDTDQHYAACYQEFLGEADRHIELALLKPGLDPELYATDQLLRASEARVPVWRNVRDENAAQTRGAQQLNKFYLQAMQRDKSAFFIGEDIADPYGGAFKVAKGLTTEYTSRALSTPISEAAIAGVGIGLAICGRRCFVEIMFGDFITYAFDQIINNASKFHHIYNGNLNCPVVIRSPMGGRRGYGPTHSQSLERFLIGIDNCSTLSLSSLAPVAAQLHHLDAHSGPVILLENKSDYAAKTFDPEEGLVCEIDDETVPTMRLRLLGATPGVTIVTYGGTARFIADKFTDIFEITDTLIELIVPVSLSPLNLTPILESVSMTQRLIVVEEGAGFGSVGAEVIAQLRERGRTFECQRVGANPVPIPSAPALEMAILPSLDDICQAIIALKGRCA